MSMENKRKESNKEITEKSKQLQKGLFFVRKSKRGEKSSTKKYIECKIFFRGGRKMAYKKNTIHKQENDALHQKEAQTAAVDNKSLPGKRGGQAKEYLGTIRIMDSMIANKVAERDHFREMLQSISCDAFSERVQTSPTNRLERGIIRLEEMDEEIDSLMNRYMDQSAVVIKQIYDLGHADYSNLLHKRYIQNLSLRNIAKEMHVSYEWARHLHGNALVEFERKYLA